MKKIELAYRIKRILSGSSLERAAEIISEIIIEQWAGLDSEMKRLFKDSAEMAMAELFPGHSFRLMVATE